jgi:hypothetical protein
MSWRDTIKIHPACHAFPALSPEELRALGEDIKANGLKHPIVLWAGGHYDDGGEVLDAVLLDGKNRLDAMELVGLTPRFTQEEDPQLADRVIVTSHDQDAATFYPVEHLYEFNGDESVDPWAYVRTANLHRRHQDAESKRDTIAALIAAEPTKSDRAIARETGTSHPTVAKVRREAEATGKVLPVAKRTGKDGKKRKQPAKRRRAKHSPTVQSAIDAINATLPKLEAEQNKMAALKQEIAEHEQVIAVGVPAAEQPAAKPYFDEDLQETFLYDGRANARYLEDLFAEHPDRITDTVLEECRNIAERWGQLAADLADMRKRARLTEKETTT